METTPTIVPVPLYISVAEVSELLAVPVETLRYWRKNDLGPVSARLEGRVRYRRADVIEWAEARFAEAAQARIAGAL